MCDINALHIHPLESHFSNLGMGVNCGAPTCAQTFMPSHPLNRLSMSISSSNTLETPLNPPLRCLIDLSRALKRNERLEKEIHQAAIMLLKLSRTVFLGSPAPSSSSNGLARRTPHFLPLDLPSELLQMVLSFVYPGALSDHQIGTVLRHAADRKTLLPRIVALDISLEPPASQRGAHAQNRFYLENARQLLVSEEKGEFLLRTGCD